jgi:hypothetical protein
MAAGNRCLEDGLNARPKPKPDGPNETQHWFCAEHARQIDRAK